MIKHVNAIRKRDSTGQGKNADVRQDSLTVRILVDASNSLKQMALEPKQPIFPGSTPPLQDILFNQMISINPKSTSIDYYDTYPMSSTSKTSWKILQSNTS
jgi:hypothetical protein